MAYNPRIWGTEAKHGKFQASLGYIMSQANQSYIVRPCLKLTRDGDILLGVPVDLWITFSNLVCHIDIM